LDNGIITVNTLEVNRPWQPDLNWATEAGQTLLDLINALQPHGEWLITIFGSAPLEMAFNGGLLSNDVDATVAWGREVEFEAILQDGALGRNQRPVYVQNCREEAFRTSPRWKDRAYLEQRGSVTLRLAHPIDILIGKLNRLEEKDIKAFELIRSRTGEPTEKTMLSELRQAADLFSLAYFKPFGPSFRQNVERLWAIFYGRTIDVEKEILTPFQQRLEKDYDQETPDYKKDLA
jgi:hypothetical protein